ncbi:MAG: rhomboid family intramembrane serine protease [Crocinitomicaceae bacterium]
MERESILAYIKRLIQESGMLGRIIAVNTAIFVVLILIRLISKLYENEELFNAVVINLGAMGDPALVIRKPWTLVTHYFTHYEFLHFLFNMIILYFSGRIFLSFFSHRRLLLTYLIGGFFAYFIHVGAYYAFPLLQHEGPSLLIGASASVMAVFFAAAVHKPNMPVMLFGILKLPLIGIAALYLLSDLMGVGSGDSVAHFAHIGGAIFGALSVINAYSSKNIMNRIDRLIFRLKAGDFKWPKRSKLKTAYTSNRSAKDMTDDEYNANKKAKEERINAILDKISKKGYDGLTKEEKDILFNESKKS